MAKMRCRGILSFPLFLLLFLSPLFAETPYPNGHLIAEPQWLKGRLGDPKLRLVDLRSKRQYQAGHIPGAVHLELEEIRATVGGVPAMMAPVEKLEAVFGRLGIDAGVTVVGYDDLGGLNASRLFWTLEYAGHPRAQILNGGFQAWVGARGEVSKEIPLISPRRFQVRLDPSRAITAEETLRRLKDPKVSIVDSRSASEYAGRDVRSKRGGHIPGAINVEWTRNLSSSAGRWKGMEELSKMYESLGVTRDKEVIVYCQTLVRAAQTYFTLRLMGYKKVRGYDGSWAEWGNREDLPIEGP